MSNSEHEIGEPYELLGTGGTYLENNEQPTGCRLGIWLPAAEQYQPANETRFWSKPKREDSKAISTIQKAREEKYRHPTAQADNETTQIDSYNNAIHYINGRLLH